MVLVTPAEGAMWGSDQPELSFSLNLNSAASRGKNHKDVLKKACRKCFIRIRPGFIEEKKNQIVRMKIF